MTETEVLARRRELVVLSAQLQRTTLVRRLDHVQQHPVNAAVRLVAGMASVPLLFKVGSLVAHKVTQKQRRMNKTQKRRFSVLALLPLLRYVPAIKAVLPRLRSINRSR